MTERLVTERLVLRPWGVEDAEVALEAYGNAHVSRWLTPAMDRVPDVAPGGVTYGSNQMRIRLARQPDAAWGTTMAVVDRLATRLERAAA